MAITALDPNFSPKHTRLDRTVREIMRPGVITIAEDASLAQAYRAMTSHGVNSVLVVGARHGTPLGWVTARGLLDWVDRDPTLTRVHQAISEEPVAIHPSANVREAVAALSRPGVLQLMVTRRDDRTPQGVVSASDVIRLAAD